MKGLAYKVSYNTKAYKGYRRDERPNLSAVVTEDLNAAQKALLPVINLLMWSGELRYRMMFGFDPVTVSAWAFRWYEYLDSRIYNQVSAALWMLYPEEMEDAAAWDALGL